MFWAILMHLCFSWNPKIFARDFGGRNTYLKYWSKTSRQKRNSFGLRLRCEKNNRLFLDCWCVVLSPLWKNSCGRPCARFVDHIYGKKWRKRQPCILHTMVDWLLIRVKIGAKVDISPEKTTARASMNSVSLESGDHNPTTAMTILHN